MRYHGADAPDGASRNADGRNFANTHILAYQIYSTQAMSKTLKKFALMLHDAGILLKANQCCKKLGCVDLALKEANKGESLAGDDDVACKNDATPMDQANQQINQDQVPFILPGKPANQL